ncbi:YgaP-like transmembrane domain [Salinirussus salinus]|jgi:Na+/H+ antiporter NhaD/arsenite permease-like protein|uniref:YgaP-like transmembrane domain n=1 Tax=Salinirussus salinus TaxID=1198300 RepID=UPI001356B1B9|nr:YgaP-like transmembrane domain [Salinirussus salinus]
MFEKNVGGLDRQVRFVAGAVLLAVALAGLLADAVGRPVALVALAGAAGLLFNALTQRCLLNRLLGVDTCGETC